MPASGTQSVAFAEIPYAAASDNLRTFILDAVIRKGHTVFELFNSVSDRIFEKIRKCQIIAFVLLCTGHFGYITGIEQP